MVHITLSGFSLVLSLVMVKAPIALPPNRINRLSHLGRQRHHEIQSMMIAQT